MNGNVDQREVRNSEEAHTQRGHGNHPIDCVAGTMREFLESSCACARKSLAMYPAHIVRRIQEWQQRSIVHHFRDRSCVRAATQLTPRRARRTEARF